VADLRLASKLVNELVEAADDKQLSVPLSPIKQSGWPALTQAQVAS